MAYEDNSPSGAAPTRARSTDPIDSDPSPMHPPPMSPLGNGRSPSAFALPRSAKAYPGRIPDDLLVPWGWMEVALFVILGVIASVVITWVGGEIAVLLLGVNADLVFGTTMSTAKSLVVLLSQALLDGGAILFLYAMLKARTDEPFWLTIGWRDLRTSAGKIRISGLQFVAGGALLAVIISFAGGFLNSKETLPIEELLQARVSIVLFGVLGVLVAPLVEETVFRGFLYPVIARRLGIAAGILVTGTLFGLTHAAQLWGGWGQIALLIFVGIVLTWVRARTGTVAASYCVHLGYNGLQLVGYLIYVVSGSHH